MAFVVFSRKRNFFPLRTNPFKVKWTVSKVYWRIDHTKHWKKQKRFFSWRANRTNVTQATQKKFQPKY
jgi:hypothetical protein